MNDKKRIEIASYFVAMHKNNDINRWQPFEKSGEEKYLAIYNNLINGMYGEPRRINEGLDNHGNHTSFGPLYQVEIGADAASCGVSIVFGWIDDEYIPPTQSMMTRHKSHTLH